MAVDAAHALVGNQRRVNPNLRLPARTHGVFALGSR
jgi:hypothetical protein